MVTITPELLAMMRQRAEQDQVLFNPKEVLAILDKLQEWEEYEGEVYAVQQQAEMSPTRASTAIKALLDRIEALEKKWERPSQWRCDGCGHVENVSDGRRPDAHPSCGGYWVRVDNA